MSEIRSYFYVNFHISDTSTCCFFSDIMHFATCIFLGMLRPRLGELGVYKKHIELKMIVFVFWLASVVGGRQKSRLLFSVVDLPDLC